MAAFSYQHHPHFPVDSVFLPNTPIKMSAFSEEPNNTTPTTTTTTTTSFSQFHPFEPPLQHHIPVDVSVHGSSNNEPSVTSKHSTYSSLISEADKLESGEQVTQKVSPMDKKRKNRDGSSLTSAQSKDARDLVKDKKQKKCSGVMINDVFDQQKKTKADKKDQKKVPEEAPTGYIHVRARRGQATDSHSLAERVRREKISERMKHLQALVPGCDKITGKALVLDEIINYVQSLQNQVEFLSMKLSCVNPMFYDFGMDLDSFMGSSGLTTPQPNMPQCSPAQPTGFSDATTTFTTNINYPHLDTSSSLAFQQGQRPNVLSQDIGHLLWNVDDHRQESINQSTFSNNLYSFH